MYLFEVFDTPVRKSWNAIVKYYWILDLKFNSKIHYLLDNIQGETKEINSTLKKKRINFNARTSFQKIAVSQKPISNWEKQKTFPDIYSLIRLAQ